MKMTLLLVAGLCTVAAPSAIRADSFQTFNVVTIMASGTLTGTLTLDETTGEFTNSDLEASFGGVNYFATGAPALIDNEPGYQRFHFNDNLPGSFFAIDVDAPSLVGFTGGALCPEDFACTGTGSLAGTQVVSGMGIDTRIPVNNVVSGSLVPSNTPEPSSLILLGTGALGMIAAVRRRRARNRLKSLTRVV